MCSSGQTSLPSEEPVFLSVELGDLVLVVGDVPPAFIPADDATTPFEVLDAYIGALEEWVEAARKGKSVAKLIPVNVDANPANAEMLAGRLKFLDERILPELR